jgi:O-antigen/teichoic acid export membrane protein
MFKHTMMFSSTIILRVLNVLGNAVGGIVLARQLSLESRGHVAIISSMIGVAVVVLSSPKGEEILRNNHRSSNQIDEREISLNIPQCFIVVVLSLLWIYKATNNQFSILWLITITLIVIASSVNSLEQAFLFNRLKFVGNQVIMTSHALMLLTFLLILFHTFGPGIDSWLIAFLLAESILLVSLHKLNAGIRISIYRNFSFTRAIKTKQHHGSKLESFSVYQAAFFLQMFTILVSATLPAKFLAFFAVGMTLASLVSLPILPFLPLLLSKAHDTVTDFQSISARKRFLILIFLISFTYLTIVLFQFLIPLFYGVKYSPLVSAVPLIVSTGLMIGGLNAIATIFRGMKRFLYSAAVNFLALIIFCAGLLFTRHRSLDIQGVFSLLLIAVSIAFTVGFFLLFARKKFHF